MVSGRWGPSRSDPENVLPTANVATPLSGKVSVVSWEYGHYPRLMLAGQGSKARSFAVAHPRVEYGLLGQRMEGSAIDSTLTTLASTNRHVISFAMGSPASDAIPTAAIAQIACDVLAREKAPAALDYSPTEGHPELRLSLLSRLEGQGLAVHPECLLVTAGGMQGLDLVCRLFLDPGDLVLAESPSYANGLATAHNQGAEIVQIPMDEEGMDVGLAEEAVSNLGRVPKLIYAIPTFQNPSGISYSTERRRQLLELARMWKAIVIEDDPYSELRYEGDSLPSLLALDESGGNVIQVRTFSKIIAPGLRLGWVVAPADAIRKMIAAKQSMDTCANSLSQQIVAGLLRTGAVDKHVENLRMLYPVRRDAMLAALSRHVDASIGVTWTSPKGGMFIWLRLPDRLDGGSIARRGLERGIAVVPGSAFDPDHCRSAVRLCFSGVDEGAIDIGVSRLAATISSLATVSSNRKVGTPTL
jgi:2-aminoadipate transaminase